MCRDPIQCIVPPHLLEQIARRGNEEQRDWAITTLATDHSLRAFRATAAMAPQTLAVPDPLGASRPGQPDRQILDVKHAEDASHAQVVRREGGPATGDAAADEAFDGFGHTYALYWDAYHRNSIDDAGLPLEGWVHFGTDYDNAFWDGRRMVFGDGDGRLFNRFTIALDVIGHELTHGVTQHEAGLQYAGESGALNESLSDVFGSLVKQHALGQTADEADWLIGAGLLAAGVHGEALRNMKAPGTAYDDPVLGKDPQPDNYGSYIHTTQDNGGVHLNSGIPNRAFYLAAVALGGHSWERAGQIWYDTVRDPRLKPTSTFSAFARRTVVNARRLYGDEGGHAVTEAWHTVGVPLRSRVVAHAD